jgi:hypothetical protein
MKRTFVIILALQLVLTLMFLVYALVQRTQALKSEELAIAEAMRANKALNEASLVSKKLEECEAGH